MAKPAEGELFAIHPMDQFVVANGDGVSPSGLAGIGMFTNQVLWLVIIVACIAALFVLGSRGRSMVPSRLQSVGELVYRFIYKMV